jgi:HSF-type DNA-binding
MNTISRRVSNASSADCPVSSVVVPRNDYGGYPRVNHGGPMHQGSLMMQGMGNMNRHHHQQVNMDNMMMNEYGRNGCYEPNALEMGPRAVQGRPVESMAMGPAVDQLMDFPSQLYIPPMRRPHPRNVSRQNMNHNQQMPQQVPSYSSGPRNDADTFAHNVPVHDSERFRSAIRSNIPSTEEVTPKPSSASATSGTVGKRKSRRPSTTSFPTKLYKILAEAKYHDVVAWLPHGRAWRVLKPKALEDDIIPKYFRSDRLASFMRQVNGWGFKRITEGPDLNAYYHEMFLRGLPHVCNKMRRPVRGESGLSRDLGQHPDFYKISMFAPLPPVTCTSSKEHDPEFETALASSPTATQAETISFQKSPGVVSRDDTSSLKDGQTSNDVKHLGQREPVGCNSDSEDRTCDGRALITSASLESPPNSPNTDRSISRNTPNAFFENYGGMQRTPSGNSLSSWNEHQDQDLMWGGQSVGSPTTGNGLWHQTDHFPCIPNVNSFGHVTPPGGPMRPNMNSVHLLPRQDQIHLPFHGSDVFDGVDDSGLSAADLCYLTQQNRILLSHATPDGAK